MVVAVVVVVVAAVAVAVAAMDGFLQCSFLFQFFVSSSSLLSSLSSTFFFLLGAVVRIFVHKKGHLAERFFMNGIPNVTDIIEQSQSNIDKHPSE